MPRNLFQTDRQFGDVQNSMPSNNPGIIDSLANSSPVQGILGAGDAVKNMMGDTLSLLPGVNIPESKSGQGGDYNVGNILGNIAGFLGGGELLDTARAGLAGAKSLGVASKLADYLGGSGKAGVARRVAGSTLGGSVVNPEDRIGGAVEGATGGALGESIPLIGKKLSDVSEYLTANKYTKSLADKLKDVYKESTAKVSSYMDPANNKFGNYKIYSSLPEKKFLNLSDDLKEKLPYDLRKEYEQIQENPNKFSFNEAHSLQQRIGEEISKNYRDIPNQSSRDAISSLSKLRNSLTDDMSKFLRQRNPQIANKWRIGSQIFRDEVIPFRSNDLIKKIVSDKKMNVTGNKLQSELIKSVENNSIPKTHYLQQTLSDISEKLNHSKALKDLLSLGSGILGGATGTGAAGTVAGAYAGKALSNPALDLITNPVIEDKIRKFDPAYKFLVKSLLANNLQGT